MLLRMSTPAPSTRSETESNTCPTPGSMPAVLVTTSFLKPSTAGAMSPCTRLKPSTAAVMPFSAISVPCRNSPAIFDRMSSFVIWFTSMSSTYRCTVGSSSFSITASTTEISSSTHSRNTAPVTVPPDSPRASTKDGISTFINPSTRASICSTSPDAVPKAFMRMVNSSTYTM